MQFNTIFLLGSVSIATAHFVLQIPTNIGFDDALEGVAPCGSFDPSDRSGGLSDLPVLGFSVGVITTHLDVTWEIKAALLSDVTNFVPLVPTISQQGVGNWCPVDLPGPSAWIGQDAVLQVIQNGPDGVLYQCAAVVFVAGGPGVVDEICTNSTGVVASYIGGGTTSSSTILSSSSSTPSSSSSSATESTASSSSVSETSSHSHSESTSSPTSSASHSHSHSNSTSTNSPDHTHSHDGYTTSTVFTTSVETITSCPPTITSCPIGKVTTKIIPLYTTICPITEAGHPATVTSAAPSATAKATTKVPGLEGSATTGAAPSSSSPLQFTGSANMMTKGSAIVMLGGAIAALLAWEI